MSYESSFSSPMVPLIINDIDTDQIIPARYLKVTDKEGLGDTLFADWRYQSNSQPNPEFILNQPEYKEARILLAGDNFGCGSSREHAVWALCGYGFRAVISTSFADIFKNNALKNGLLPIEVTPTIHQQLVQLVKSAPTTQVSVDLQTQQVAWPELKKVKFSVDPFTKYRLMNGVDELGYIFRFESEIRKFEAVRW
ncbi:MAG: 3-isopropylmalate dehydratase small subunit [bacterium]